MGALMRGPISEAVIIVLLGFLKYFKGGYEIGRINPATDALPLLLLRTAVRRASPQGPHCQSAARQKGRLTMTPQLLRSARRVGFADWAGLDTPNKETEAEPPVPSWSAALPSLCHIRRGIRFYTGSKLRTWILLKSPAIGRAFFLSASSCAR